MEIMTTGKHNIPARQHYVSQMQLLKFTDKNGKFYCFNKLAGDILYTSPSNAFIKKHIYTYESTSGEKNTEVEAEFSRLEGAVKPIIDKLICAGRNGHPPRLSPSEKETWDLFFYLQWKRVPDLHNRPSIKSEADAHIDSIFNALRKNHPDLVASIEAIDTPSERERIKQGAKVMAVAHPYGEVRALLGHHEVSIQKVYSPGERFVIGSLPIVRFGGNMRTDDMQAWLPIAPDLLAGFKADHGARFLARILDPKFVRNFNQITANQSTMFAGPDRPTIESLAQTCSEQQA